MNINSITGRLTLLFGAVATLVLAGLGIYVGAAVDGHFIEGDRDLLHGKLQLTRQLLLRFASPAELESNLPQQLDTALVGHHDLSVVIESPDGKTLFASSGTHYPGPQIQRLPADADAGAEPQRWEHDGRTFRGIAARADTGIDGADPVRVAIALEIGHHQAFMAQFRRTHWLAIGVAMAVTMGLGLLIARRCLRPLHDMTSLARGISSERLDQRLSLAELPSELVDLAAAFNLMLDRLQQGFARLAEFSADLAHEIRTPLSNLMTQTGVALSRERSAIEYREALASNAEEFERLARITGDMLFLAKSDNGLVVPQREALALGAEIDDLFAFYGVLAEEQGVRLVRSGEATVSGDRLMLRRALGNLLANAIAFAPAGSQVRVRLVPTGQGASVAVHNAGEPIPPEQLERVFDRFYRGDPSRQKTSDGAGLGLAITRSIARAHGGDIALRSDATGTTFTIELPSPAKPREALGTSSESRQDPGVC